MQKDQHSKKLSTKPVKKERHIHQKVKQNNVEASRQPAWLTPLIMFTVFIVYLPVFSAGFVNLDDADYVTTNSSLLNGNLSELILKPVQGNYHPLTMLSLYFNFIISGKEAWSYHVFNLLLHLINCLLVFKLVMKLSNGKLIVAFFTSVLFGIHPMHVESVAWVSERKDVLYSLFFLWGLISYIQYRESRSAGKYILTLALFLLSLLSKPSAVIFPLALIAIDLIYEKAFNFKILKNKIAFFVVSFLWGILILYGQRSAGAVGQETFSPVYKMLFGFYGIMMYLLKMFLPLKLSVFYPYPAINKSLSAEYYLAPLFFLILAFIFWKSLKNKREVSFGILFFLVNLLLVLQFVPVGSAVIAERYTYIPYIGLFFILGGLINKWADSNWSKANLIIIPVIAFYGFLAFRQAGVWKTSETLWDQAVNNQPSNKAFANRGIIYKNAGKNDLAFKDFADALKLNTLDHETYNNRANLYFKTNQPQKAIEDYKKAISLKPDFYTAMDNLAAQYATIGQFDSALKYENRVILLNPDYPVAYSNRALMYMAIGRYDEAIKDWQKLLQYEPNAADIYNSIGNCLQNLKRYPESLKYIDQAIQMDPQPVFFLSRSYSYLGMNNLEAAKKDALFAQSKGIVIPPGHAANLGLR